jgi:hypothetical protein
MEAHQGGTMDKKTFIALPEPRRSWLVHCTDAFGDLGVCVIAVQKGAITIYAPDDSENFELEPRGIAEFREAFNAAIDVAEADLRAKGLEMINTLMWMGGGCSSIRRGRCGG